MRRSSEVGGLFVPLFSDFYKNGGGRCALSLETKVVLQRKKVKKMDGVFVMNQLYSFKLAFFVKKSFFDISHRLVVWLLLCVFPTFQSHCCKFQNSY